MKAKNQPSTRKPHGARLGQHFLTNPWAAKKLVEASGADGKTTILEIGPGRGALTREILAVGASVIAIEKDEALVTHLQETFSDACAKGALRIVEGDVRTIELHTLGIVGEYTVAANIPYYITGEIIRKLLTTPKQPKTVALLVQKEVAERIVARDTKESILSLSVKCYGEPSIAARVSRGNFTPAPSVDSAILVIRNISRDFFTDIDEEKFFEIIRRGFASKRKKLANNLGVAFGRTHIEGVFEKLELSPNVRAEDVSLEMWKNITRTL
ncbi:MAG TPA: 16S rRNA (adenine(1518)-N(6)/adenine(1519)-N(6))-dimethyltransferase RsmA [Candidatus Paceibacterota bacterium]